MLCYDGYRVYVMLYCMERCCVRVNCTSTRQGILLSEDRVEVICVERSDRVTLWM